MQVSDDILKNDFLYIAVVFHRLIMRFTGDVMCDPLYIISTNDLRGNALLKTTNSLQSAIVPTF